MIAHVAGLPIEEAVVAVALGGGAGLTAARAWLGARLVRRRTPAQPPV